ncbi:hypothetical protein WJX73_001230 [Symbiochloris irregularis]|uniref:Uncharacterized protein n=1 Tax=Symbiochloris irregularis TaxID=706552 RepID=A0AAW1PV43_9CHLO
MTAELVAAKDQGLHGQLSLQRAIRGPGRPSRCRLDKHSASKRHTGLGAGCCGSHVVMVLRRGFFTVQSGHA